MDMGRDRVKIILFSEDFYCVTNIAPVFDEFKLNFKQLQTVDDTNHWRSRESSKFCAEQLLTKMI